MESYVLKEAVVNMVPEDKCLKIHNGAKPKSPNKIQNPYDGFCALGKCFFNCE